MISISRSLANTLIGMIQSVVDDRCSEATKILKENLEKMSGKNLSISHDEVELVIGYLFTLSDTHVDNAREILELAIGKHTREAGYMHSCYRCPDCGETWQDYQNCGEADHCPACESGPVEPYAIRDLDADGPFAVAGDDEAFEAQALVALAEHEKAHPVKNEFGCYMVEVVRTGIRSAVIEVSDAEGPANAQLKAINRAGDHEFGSERDYDFSTSGIDGFTRKLQIGSQYHWSDPDSSPESDCSCRVTVSKIREDLAYVRRADGTEFEVHPSELH